MSLRMQSRPERASWVGRHWVCYLLSSELTLSRDPATQKERTALDLSCKNQFH